MTKSEAKSILIKDLTIAGVAVVVIGLIIGILAGKDMGISSGILIGIFGGIYFAGLPFGWRWISKLVTALGWLSLLIKIGFAIALGFIAFPVTIIIDIIRLCKATDDINVA